MARVSLEGVSKVFPGPVVAVGHLDMEVRDQEFLVLVGPSGCGKSTTLRMIAGLEDVSTGRIRIDDVRVERMTPRERNIAMVFQSGALYPHLTVFGNMAFGLRMRLGGSGFARFWKRLTRPAEAAVQRQRIQADVRQAARILGIEHLLGRRPGQLSGGERQRVALGRAIVRKPAAFLLDEPLSHLDAQLRSEMRRELKQLHQRLRTTMIYVTHDQIEALTLGERIVVMNRGEIQQIGPPAEVYDQPKNRFVAGFLGAPAMNFVAGRLVQRAEEVEFRGGGLEVGLDASGRDASGRGRSWRELVGEEVVLGIRPEDIKVSAAEAGDRSEVRPTADRGVCAQSSRTSALDRTNLGRVSMVESQGDAVVLHLEIAAASSAEKNCDDLLVPQALLVCKAPSRTNLRPGDQVRVGLVSARTHLFDPQSGDNMTFVEKVKRP